MPFDSFRPWYNRLQLANVWGGIIPQTFLQRFRKATLVGGNMTPSELDRYC